MDLPAELRSGLTGTAEIVVGTRDTAPHVGSGKIGVLATPIMVNLMESAALQAVASASGSRACNGSLFRAPP